MRKREGERERRNAEGEEASDAWKWGEICMGADALLSCWSVCHRKFKGPSFLYKGSCVGIYLVPRYLYQAMFREHGINGATLSLHPYIAIISLFLLLVHAPTPSLAIDHLNRISSLALMNTTPCPPLLDRTGTLASSLHASGSQADTHSCPAPTSWPRTFDKMPLESCARTPDGTLHFPPTDPSSFVLQPPYQSSFERLLIHPSLHPSPPPPTHQRLTQSQLLPENQQWEEQLQWQLIHWDQWIHQFQLQQFQLQLAYLQQQQQQRPEQLAAPQNTPPFQEPLPMNNRPLASTTQPWVSEVLL